MPHARTPANARRLVAATLCALLLAQSLAFWHAIAHAPGLGRVIAGVTADAHGDAEASPGAWGHAAGDAACRLVDQLLQGGATLPDLPAVAAGPVPQRLAAVACPAAARGIAAAFLARGPPRA